MGAGSRSVIHYVADTHALFWYLTASPKLGPKAKGAFDAAVRGEGVVYVPAIVIADLFFLIEKAGRPLDFRAEFNRLRSASQFAFVPFEAQDVVDFDADSAIPEMHDRMIVGVARRLGATLLTRDPAMVANPAIASAW